MDPPLAPPVRIRPISATPIAAKVTRKHIDNFLDGFQARSTSAQSGSSAVTVQLQKLAIALKGERKLVKKQSQ